VSLRRRGRRRPTRGAGTRPATSPPNPFTVDWTFLQAHLRGSDTRGGADADQLFGPPVDGAQVVGEIIDGPAGAGWHRHRTGCGLDESSEALDFALEKATVFEMLHACGFCQARRAVASRWGFGGPTSATSMSCVRAMACSRSSAKEVRRASVT